MELLKIVEAYAKGMPAVECAVEGLKAAKDKLPNGEEKETIVKKIEEVEHALRLAKAELGESLGYKLCQCTWPPQVMAREVSSEKEPGEQLKCPNCGKIEIRPQVASVEKEARAFDPYDVY